MNTDLLYHWLTLHASPKIGSKKLHTILDQGLDIAEIVKYPERYQTSLKLHPLTIEHLKKADLSMVEAALAWQQASTQHHILFYTDKQYPEALRHIDNPPIILFVAGELEVLSQNQIAIVGTRNYSSYGKANAAKFSRELTQAGFVITSGLALGVDTIAHESCLAEGGKTIAVMGTGINCIYPRQNQKLAQQIIQQLTQQ